MNDEFGLPTSSYSVSDIQDYLEYIIKKHKLSATNPLAHVYINRNNKRVLFKIKDGYKPELQTFQTRKLKIINKSKNGENIPSLEVDEINKQVNK